MKQVGACAFAKCEQLRRILLNEGLEKLGPEETVNGNRYEGNVFAESAVERVQMPSTLVEIPERTFDEC